MTVKGKHSDHYVACHIMSHDLTTMLSMTLHRGAAFIKARWLTTILREPKYLPTQTCSFQLCLSIHQHTTLYRANKQHSHVKKIPSHNDLWLHLLVLLPCTLLCAIIWKLQRWHMRHHHIFPCGAACGTTATSSFLFPHRVRIHKPAIWQTLAQIHPPQLQKSSLSD